MLRVEANFIYQRKGLYEVILGKITEKERASGQSKTRDELAERVAGMSNSSGGFGGGGFGGGGFGGGGFAPQRVIDQKKEEDQKFEEEASYIEKVLKLYESMVL